MQRMSSSGLLVVMVAIASAAVSSGCGTNAASTSDAAARPESTSATTVAPPTPSPAAANDPSDLQAKAAAAIALAGGQADSTFEVHADESGVDAAGNPIAPGASWVCAARIDNPHWSKKGLTVLAKVYITCSGPTATLPISVQEVLGQTSKPVISDLKIKYQKYVVQTIQANMPANKTPPWYIPIKGQGYSFPRGYYYRMSYSAAAAPPLVPFSVGTGVNAFSYVS